MNEELLRRVMLMGLLVLLGVLSYAVLYRFLIPVAWAAILVYVTWPVYSRLRDVLGGHRTISALAMTFVLGAVLVLPLILLIGLIRNEAPALYKIVTERLNGGLPPLPKAIENFPYLGGWIDSYWRQWTNDPSSIKEPLQQFFKNSSDEIIGVVGDVGRNAAKGAIALLTAFFFYRDGERIFEQMRRFLQRLQGSAVDGYLVAVGVTTNAVMYGLVATALAQGFIAGLGYWGAGVSMPVTLGAVTALIALIPFGAPFVWGSIGLWLLVTGNVWQGVGLLLWGVLVVSWVDNFIRPIIISRATRASFLMVMFGVLGGLAAFGLIGLFVGPVILAVMMALWREWLGSEA